MAAPLNRAAVKDHLLHDNESSDKPSQFATYGHETQEQGYIGTVKQQKLQRYWVRTLALILIPPAITTWYAIIWLRFLVGTENDEAANYRTFSGSLIYVSWFIIGVFGLMWAQYGLLGVELAMLQTPFWKAPNLVTILMHSNTTWSSPTGWWKAIYHREFHKLWCLLMFLSIVPFVAFPLSGLAFEIGDGYIATSEHPFVTGRNTSTYSNATIDGYVRRGAWNRGLTPTIPGFGVAYTAPDIDRSQHSCLEKVPNTLPLADSVPDMFLAPQADVPVSGETWGLRVKYECSIVQKASEFTILSEKPKSIFSRVASGSIIENSRPVVTLQTPSGYTIQISNSTAIVDSGTSNIWSYSEMGTSVFETTTYEIENDTTSKALPLDEISKSMVFEYALWQLQFHGYYDEPNVPLPFNTTLGPTVEGMGSPFFISDNKTLLSNTTFFKIGQGENFTLLENDRSDFGMNASVTDLREYLNPTPITEYRLDKFPEPIIQVAAPVGVRCVVSSGAGTATLDGITSTFRDFSRVGVETDIQGHAGGVFGHMAQDILTGTQFADFYKPGHLPGPQLYGSDMIRYQSYISSTALLQSVMLAYGTDALQLMYGVTSGFEAGWLHTDLSSSKSGRILVVASIIQGQWLGYFVLALLFIWSVLSLALGLVYGFRKRPADKLDGYDMFKRGAYMADYFKHNDEALRKSSFYGNKTLQALPDK
ncbi:hypothetical protein O988_00420 [Pseudogymnoascus sp. VKM F-3808]|nr:hypothetical protein O988_00420 [Pseudogymnoascus sp. VKM F-3808]